MDHKKKFMVTQFIQTIDYCQKKKLYDLIKDDPTIQEEMDLFLKAYQVFQEFISGNPSLPDVEWFKLEVRKNGSKRYKQLILEMINEKYYSTI